MRFDAPPASRYEGLRGGHRGSMAANYRREQSSMARWSWKTACFAVVLLVTVVVGHRYGLVQTEGFLWVLGLVFLLAVIGLILSWVAIEDLWNNGNRSARIALLAAPVCIGLIAPYVWGIYLVLRYPPLTDISTDLVEPPVMARAQLLRTPRMNRIEPISEDAAALQMRYYPEVAGRRFDASMDRVMQSVAAVVAASGWRPRTRLPDTILTDEFTFEADAPTAQLRIPSDAGIRLIADGQSVFVDMRLSTRYLRHDLGYNARRIGAFMTELEAEFERQSIRIIDIPPSSDEEGSID